MKYEEIENSLKKSINQKGLNLLFAQSIKDLKSGFDVEVSTKFLRGLSDLNDTRKQSKRISYLMRKANLKTKRVSNIYEIRGINKYKTSVVRWGHDKTTTPYPKIDGLTDDEKKQIAEIESLKLNSGIGLFNHAEEDQRDRQKRRDAFNYGGGAVVRDVKVIHVGNFAIMHRQEILRVVC